MAIQMLTTDNFKQVVETEGKTVLVDFYADWCVPCKMITPVLEELSAEMEGKAKICKINIDENVELAAQYAVTVVPTMLFFKNSEVVGKLVGLHPKDKIKSELEAL